MATILSMLRRFEALDTDKVITDTMQQSTDAIADTSAEQINSGIKSDGTEMPDYSFRSVFQYGKQPGPIRLRDKGSWQAGKYAAVVGDRLVISSTDPKNDMLENNPRWAGQIHLLSDKYKAEVMREAVRPAFKQNIEQATGLKMK